MNHSIPQLILNMGKQAKAAALKLAVCSTGDKNDALNAMAEAIKSQTERILSANAMDMAQAEKDGLSAAMLDRLRLDKKRVASMAKGVDDVATLPDPVGEIIREWTRPNGLHLQKIRVPLGVIGIIYESRPNVTADSACLCVKAGNACILRGGSEAFHTNTAIAAAMNDAAKTAGLPNHIIQLVPTTDRATVRELARLDKYLSCIIPRGGEGLIRAVVENSTVPVIKHYQGICHVYVDETADFDMAERIIINAKCQRPGVCNAMETLLIHKKIAGRFLPLAARSLLEHKVELRMEEDGLRILAKTDLQKKYASQIRPATEEDWSLEYLDLILSIRIVDSIDQAIEHINAYGSSHSDCIVTGNRQAARRFHAEVDSATVYHNASTRFTDGAEFGMGAEIGISTDRLHARGPMALEELTTYKYLIHGAGQIRE
ncbi:MAG: glutamate-5-semialdehyde dehydrogenase [Verrucomicrobiae bacterium]|nr:glutamate-5-semialdehyde dehydrogenase [Verrucomicrobiae bacterium]